MDADDAFIDPRLRPPPAGLGLQQDPPLYHFPPVNLTPLPVVAVPAPVAPPPTAPYQIAAGGKLTKDSVVREFVLVETKIQQLEHNLQLTQNENVALRMLLTRVQAENELRFREMQKNYEDHLEQRLEQCREQFRVTHASRSVDFNGSTDSSSSEDEEISAKKKKLATEAEEARISIAASKHSKILVSNRYLELN
jgi:hypothetical protein